MRRTTDGKADRRPGYSDKTLTVVLQSLIGVRVVIELKNDTEVTGTLEDCDDDMNMNLMDTRCITCEGKVLEQSIMFVQGRSIRYVHIPDRIRITTHLRNHMNRLELVKNKNKVPEVRSQNQLWKKNCKR
mmetsp:Transcript_13156/g.24743  ORF Transcript_13156/g.24743 Transcript_13156/m.24743 type:complete len:130 (-) Transcript_13156:1-390(-)